MGLNDKIVDGSCLCKCVCVCALANGGTKKALSSGTPSGCTADHHERLPADGRAPAAA